MFVILFYFSTDYFNNIVVLCNYSSSISTGAGNSGAISTGGSGVISTGGSGAITGNSGAGAISTGGSGAGGSGAGGSGAGGSGAGGSGAIGPDIAPSFGTSQYSFGSLGLCHNPESVGSNTPQSQCSRTNPRTAPDTPDMFFSSSGLSSGFYRAGMLLLCYYYDIIM
jgi:hypothetical protein